MKVSWDDEIPNIWKVIKFHVPNHQPEFYKSPLLLVKSPFSYGFPMVLPTSNHNDNHIPIEGKWHGRTRQKYTSPGPKHQKPGLHQNEHTKYLAGGWATHFKTTSVRIIMPSRMEHNVGNHKPSSLDPLQYLPSGRRLHNYGKSPFLVGKSTISMVSFNN